MCGRYTSPSSYDATIEEFSITRVVPVIKRISIRFNIAPTSETPVIFEEDGERLLDNFFWTFIPPWSPDGKPGKFSAINARDDKIASSKLYAPSFRSRRCIVPVGGFYEWQGKKSPKQPYFIHHPKADTLALAGVWSHWKAKDGSAERNSFAIITTKPNGVMQPLHDRMPVILDAADWNTWLDRDMADTDALQGLLRPCPDEKLEAYPVSTEVNKPGNDSPSCVEPVGLL